MQLLYHNYNFQFTSLSGICSGREILSTDTGICFYKQHREVHTNVRKTVFVRLHRIPIYAGPSRQSAGGCDLCLCPPHQTRKKICPGQWVQRGCFDGIRLLPDGAAVAGLDAKQLLDVHLVLPVPRHPRHRDWAAVCPGIQSGALDSPVLAGRADGRLLGAVYGLGQCVDVRAAGPTAPPHRPPCTVEEYALCVLWVFPAD